MAAYGEIPMAAVNISARTSRGYHSLAFARAFEFHGRQGGHGAGVWAWDREDSPAGLSGRTLRGRKASGWQFSD